MKTTQPGDTKPVPPLSRRKFLEQGAGAALALSVVPRHVLGGPGYVPPSDKVNIAFIGVGSQGLRVMLHFLKEPDVQGVAVRSEERRVGKECGAGWSAADGQNRIR